MRFIDKEILISDKIRILTDWVPSTRRIISQSTESFIDVSYFIKVCSFYINFFLNIKTHFENSVDCQPRIFSN